MPSAVCMRGEDIHPCIYVEVYMASNLICQLVSRSDDCSAVPDTLHLIVTVQPPDYTNCIPEVTPLLNGALDSLLALHHSPTERGTRQATHPPSLPY